jgi:transcriptional regulator with XRE-family HTH domain
MTGSSYGERDYAFGQLMLTLCTIIDLTQASLADRLVVSRRAVAEWEGGSNYPKVERLKQLLVSGAFLARICRWATTLSIQSDTRELHLILSGTSITRKHRECCLGQ